ncbi:1,2-dihydroxy-3-keto-5-methylthiopentene dioxygenase [Puccinia graminis f. sp. tritici]|uniref:Acireductone dioxygenase n=1 Tax=Puccinia graminis f. sp. tritici TaxID=56615 RepID=A0A5B0Q1S7_PUCGR|nr:1,2-dihydroxy-3-keto-5-methylthiopentene dioxygenase [Puccinia graminis f. sp. tritici]KAA1127921.1 1,2-dihydroxy-3-keto-5-methylthiopentene dioxygenase [Puccinia graminis f. sp. tritici]
MRAYIYDEESQLSPQDEHDSNESVSKQELQKLGVLYWSIDSIDQVNSIAIQRDYKNRDQIICSPQAMGDIYQQKLDTFFEEHLHEDEEIRWVVEGSGYFDVRDQTDQRWVRIKVEKGDLLVLPPGIFHRFTVDKDNYIKAMRLFKDEPKWVALNRSTESESNPYRKAYIEQVGKAMTMGAF